jgi:hypothetical protein
MQNWADFLKRAQRRPAASFHSSPSEHQNAAEGGKAFSAKNFLDIASRTTIDVTLANLTQTFQPAAGDFSWRTLA